MARLTKFRRSQNAHKGIAEKYRGSVIFDGPYVERVRSIYHNNVYQEQGAKRRILSYREKRDIMNYALKVAK